MKNIFLIGGKAGSGKDTFYNILTTVNKEKYNTYKIVRFSFAEAIKKIAVNQFNWNQVKDDYGRKLLIFLGSYLGDEITFRNKLCSDDMFNENLTDKVYSSWYEVKEKLDILFTKDKNFWVDIVKDKLYNNYDLYDYCFITDFRFKKEYVNLSICFDNVKTIKIDRRKVIKIDSKSENDLNDFTFDYVVRNNKDLNEFKSEIVKFFDENLKK